MERITRKEIGRSTQRNLRDLTIGRFGHTHSDTDDKKHPLI